VAKRAPPNGASADDVPHVARTHHFAEQRAHGSDVWQEPFVQLRLPKLFNLRTDPFERADHEGIGYTAWRFERAYLLVPAQAYVSQWLASFRDFPPRQRPASFSLDQVMEKLQQTAGDR
jgi:arylsulfatase